MDGGSVPSPGEVMSGPVLPVSPGLGFPDPNSVAPERLEEEAEKPPIRSNAPNPSPIPRRGPATGLSAQMRGPPKPSPPPRSTAVIAPRSIPNRPASRPNSSG